MNYGWFIDNTNDVVQDRFDPLIPPPPPTWGSSLNESPGKHIWNTCYTRSLGLYSAASRCACVQTLNKLGLSNKNNNNNNNWESLETGFRNYQNISRLIPVEGEITGTSLVSRPNRPRHRTPTSSPCEQSVRPQIPCGQSSREVSDPSQCTSSSRIRPTPSPKVPSDTTSAWPLQAEKTLLSALVKRGLVSFFQIVRDSLGPNALEVKVEQFRLRLQQKLLMWVFLRDSEYLMFNITQTLRGNKQATVLLEKNTDFNQ